VTEGVISFLCMRYLLEKLLQAQLVTKFSTSYGTKDSYHIHESSPLDLTLSQKNLVYNLIPI
jgi:hypothetical protein